MQANLLLTRNCDLVISDFGLARQMPEGAAHPMTEHVVTRWYRGEWWSCDHDYLMTANKSGQRLPI